MSRLNPSTKSMSTVGYFGRDEYSPNPVAVSVVSPSVVGLTYYSGDEFRVLKDEANGTIFSCIPDHDNGQYVSYILTTSDFFDKSEVSSAFKIEVSLPTGELYEGEVMACDEEINIAVIKVKSDELLPMAILTPFSDCISLSPFGVSGSHAAFCLSPYPTKVFPGDELTIVSTVFGEASRALVVSGTFSIDRIGYDYDIQPFLRINCRERIMNGAPVINCEGDVIGVAFNIYGECVAFLPVNIFFKWWKHVVTYGEICRPWIGMSFTNLYAAALSCLEVVVHDCDVYNGVLIDEVKCGSPADSAGMRYYDVICQCDGRPVRSLLEFTELLWDKSGEVIETKGVRNGCHFVWKVEIEAIKASILPDWLAKLLAENVVAMKKSTKRGKNKAKDKKKSKKDKEGSGLKAKKRTRDVRADAVSDPDGAEKLESEKSSLSVPRFGAIKTRILPALAQDVATEAIKREIMQAENVAAKKKSTKRLKKGKNKAEGKEKAYKDKEGTGLKAKTRKGDAYSITLLLMREKMVAGIC